jgi:hypothetical protein
MYSCSYGIRNFVLLICFKSSIVLCIGPYSCLLFRIRTQQSDCDSVSVLSWSCYCDRCTWFTTNRSCRTLPSHRTLTHTPKPNKPVDPQLASSQQLQLHATHTKTASVVPPEDGRLTPKTSKGLKHNEVIVKVKVC